MQEIPDSELDELFRKSLNTSNIPFEEKAWNAMEKKLDDENRRRAFYWRISGGIASLLLLVGVSTIVINKNSRTGSQLAANSNLTTTATYTNKNEKNNSFNTNGDNGPVTNIVSYSVVKPQEQNGTSQTNRIKVSKNAISSSGNSLKATTIKEQERTKGTDEAFTYTSHYITKRHKPNTSNSAETINNNNSTERKEQNTTTVSSYNSGSTIYNSNIKDNTKDLADNSLINSNNTDLGVGKAGSDNFTEETKYLTTATSLSQGVVSDEQNVNSNSNMAKETAYTTKETIKDSTKNSVTDSTSKFPVTALAKTDTASIHKKKTHLWSLNLVMNPEFSTSPSMDFYKPGSNVGLMAEYYLCNRMSVIVGGLYSTKNYTADGYQYKSETNSLPHNKVPSYVIGNCNVIEVPVLVRYKFLRKATYNIYASSGLLSYIMLKERYTYVYNATATSKGWSAPHEVINQNRYFFSIFTASIGIEKYLNERWSVQAEPYVQVPLSGIGDGRIMLISSGAYFTVKHYFGLKK